MKRFLSIILALLSAFVLASCKGTNDKDAQNTAPPHSAASETAAPTESPTAAPETEAPTADLNPRPDPVTVEWLAAEMQCRYYVGCMNLELMDFSNIMDRNEDTDLFFWDNQIAIDRMKFNPDYNFTAVFIKEVYVEQIVDETETEITADVYVFTSHPNPTFSMSGIGMGFRITVDKQRMVIISYSEPMGAIPYIIIDCVRLPQTIAGKVLPGRKPIKKHMKSSMQNLPIMQADIREKHRRADQSCVQS